MTLRICLINVGANSANGKLRSPIFEDGTFEFVPIPDYIIEFMRKKKSILIRYKDLPPYNGRKLLDFIPREFHNMYAHYDPEFETYTYGDYPSTHGRAANLKKIRSGDHIFFLSRLVEYNGNGFTKNAGFYIIGYFEVDQIFRNITGKLESNEFEKIAKNAHMIRGECNNQFYDEFWIFKGSRRSKRFKYAVPFNREVVKKCGIKDVFGKEWVWDKFRTELSAIGSYVRAAKIIEEKSQVQELWKHITTYN